MTGTYATNLTGAKRYRKGWFGKAVLQVEKSFRPICPHTFTEGPLFYRWVDASYEEAFQIMMEDCRGENKK